MRYKIWQRARLLFSISHRLVNVVKADAIYVMVNGKIAESGKHRELLKIKRIMKSCGKRSKD